jgi:hypothetical protein
VELHLQALGQYIIQVRTRNALNFSSNYGSLR